MARGFASPVSAVWSLILMLVAAAPANVQGGDCRPTCGHLTIKEPFGIVPDEATDGNCGLLGFQVICQNHTAYLGYYRLNKNTDDYYQVQILDIFYGNGSLLVADMQKHDDLTNLTGEGCHHFPTSNTSSKIALPFSISHNNQQDSNSSYTTAPSRRRRRRWRPRGSWRGDAGRTSQATRLLLASEGVITSRDTSWRAALRSSCRCLCDLATQTRATTRSSSATASSRHGSRRRAYRVVSIFADNQSLHVVDINLPLATGGCPAPTFNVTTGSGLNPIVFSKANKELLVLGKCTGPSPQVPAGFRNLTCDNTSFVRLGDGQNFSSSYIEGGIPQGCLFTVVPTLRVPDGNGDDYIAGMKNGFLLEWTEVPGDCPKCMASGGECVYGDKFACKCSGSLRPEECGI